jgi:hypothetical protein
MFEGGFLPPFCVETLYDETSYCFTPDLVSPCDG